MFEKCIVFKVCSLKTPVLEGKVVRFLRISAKIAFFNKNSILAK